MNEEADLITINKVASLIPVNLNKEQIEIQKRLTKRYEKWNEYERILNSKSLELMIEQRFVDKYIIPIIQQMRNPGIEKFSKLIENKISALNLTGFAF